MSAERGHAVPSAVSSEHRETRTSAPTHNPPPTDPPNPSFNSERVRFHGLDCWPGVSIHNPPDTSCICSACAGMWHGGDDTAALARCSQSECTDYKQPNVQLVKIFSYKKLRPKSSTSLALYNCYYKIIVKQSVQYLVQHIISWKGTNMLFALSRKLPRKWLGNDRPVKYYVTQYFQWLCKWQTTTK